MGCCLSDGATSLSLFTFVGGEDALEEEMSTRSSILAWKIPWTEELGGLQSRGPQRVRYDLVTEHASPFFLPCICED